MKIRNSYMYLTGFVCITVEGFFVERFINSCFSNEIFLWDLRREKTTYLRVKISVKDFKKIRKIARNTKCKVKIESKNGVPIILNKYKKRKIFAIAILMIAIFIFISTRFIWNIEIVGNNKINEYEIISILKENEIDIGTKKSKIETEKLINNIRLERDDISWVGIDIKGTNLIVKMNEADEAPEVVDKSKVCNIVADRSGIISSIVVHNGTARVEVGDKVEKGDLLVEGIMEGKYTGIRQVHAQADIMAKIYYEKEEKDTLLQHIETKTGKEQKKIEIKMNKFKINFNKMLSNFKKYDTIVTTKKVKFFSNYYLPIEISKITYIETKNEDVEYTVEELVQLKKEKLQKELDEELALENKDNVEEQLEVEVQENTVNVKLIYIIQERIGTKEIN